MVQCPLEPGASLLRLPLRLWTFLTRNWNQDRGSGEVGVFDPNRAGIDDAGPNYSVRVCGWDQWRLQVTDRLQLHHQDVPLQEHSVRPGGGEFTRVLIRHGRVSVERPFSHWIPVICLWNDPFASIKGVSVCASYVFTCYLDVCKCGWATDVSHTENLSLFILELWIKYKYKSAKF